MYILKLKESIYKTLYHSLSAATTTDSKVLVMEAMLNLMQATFVVLQSSPSLDEQTLFTGQETFHTLYTYYFKENMEVGL